MDYCQFFSGSIVLLNLLHHFKGFTLYLTHFPVLKFARHIILPAGISEVVYCTFFGKDADKWERKDIAAVKKFLDSNQITFM